MKKIYIKPSVQSLYLDCSSVLLAGSGGNGSGGYQAGSDQGGNSETGNTGATSGSGLSQCSKKFNAWETWDEY